VEVVPGTVCGVLPDEVLVVVPEDEPLVLGVDVGGTVAEEVAVRVPVCVAVVLVTLELPVDAPVLVAGAVGELVRVDVAELAPVVVSAADVGDVVGVLLVAPEVVGLVVSVVDPEVVPEGAPRW
jgi:N-acetylglucosamine kinase-like BadF-type ATPase